MVDRGPFANMRSGRFSIPKFTALPSDIDAMRNMSNAEKDEYVERKLLEHKRALSREFEVNKQQALLENLTRTCFLHCMTNPGPRFTEDERTCVDDCVDGILRVQTDVLEAIITKARQDGLTPGPFKPLREHWEEKNRREGDAQPDVKVMDPKLYELPRPL